MSFSSYFNQSTWNLVIFSKRTPNRSALSEQSYDETHHSRNHSQWPSPFTILTLATLFHRWQLPSTDNDRVNLILCVISKQIVEQTVKFKQNWLIDRRNKRNMLKLNRIPIVFWWLCLAIVQANERKLLIFFTFSGECCVSHRFNHQTLINRNW